MKSLLNGFLFSLCCLLAAPLAAQNQITGGSCSASNLSGTYTLTLDGQDISSTGGYIGSSQGIGTATFDGVSNVIFNGTVNTNLALGKAFTYSGTYTLPSNCYGTITLTTGSSGTFTLVVWDSGKEYNIAGSDSTYVYTGSGGNIQPSACATSTLSGEFTYQASGFLPGTVPIGGTDEAGLMQFDGQGNASASYSVSKPGAAPTTITSSGTYSVTSNCLASATLTDSNGLVNTLNFVVTGVNGNALVVLESNSQFVRTGGVHAAFLNPANSITNAASYVVGATPPGSIFALFGVGLATRQFEAVSVPLPTTLLTTSVTVNGEQAPLFFVDTGQIDAQMPWDIPAGSVATVIVTNGTAISNPAAVYVPATGTPGIIATCGNNRACVLNQDNSLNTGSNGANVGDEVQLFFLGGGPVQASGALVSGHLSPGGLSPITGAYNITVGGTEVTTIDYIGLSPGSVGLYQANFIVPPLAKGTYGVVVTIDGQASNSAFMNVK